MKERWLTPFNPNIPTEFDDALSYYEELKVCYMKMKEAMRLMRNQTYYILEKADNNTKKLILQSEKEIKTELREEYKTGDVEQRQYTDQEIAAAKVELKANIAEIETSLEAFKITTEAHMSIIDDTAKNLNQKLEIITGQHNSLTNFIVQEMQSMRNDIAEMQEKLTVLKSTLLDIYIDFEEFKVHVMNIVNSSIESMEAKINAQITRANLDMLMVTSPVTGDQVNLRKALRQLADNRADMPITVREFNELKITAREFNALKITGRQFNMNALYYLRKYLNNVELVPIISRLDELSHRVEELEKRIDNYKWLSLITGKPLEPYECFREIADLVMINHINPITGSKFNKLNITAKRFNEMQITAKEFNTYGANILTR